MGRAAAWERDKALLPWGEKTLLGHALAPAARSHRTGGRRGVCADRNPVTGDQGSPVFPDVVLQGGGALGGVLTGLERLPADADFGLFLAVDLPLVPTALLRRLLERAEQPGSMPWWSSPPGVRSPFARSMAGPASSHNRQNVEGRSSKEDIDGFLGDRRV